MDALFEILRIHCIWQSRTRTSGYKGATPIHRVIEHRHVSLPSDWNKFIALEGFARFTSEQVVGKEQQIVGKEEHAKTIEVASGFNKPFDSRTDSSRSGHRYTGFPSGSLQFDTLQNALAQGWYSKNEEINPN